MQKYLVTRRFTEGVLKGLTHTGETPVSFPVGFMSKKIGAGTPFVVVSCAEVSGDYSMPLSLNKPALLHWRNVQHP